MGTRERRDRKCLDTAVQASLHVQTRLYETHTRTEQRQELLPLDNLGLPEWHLHKPVTLQMPISTHSFTSFGPRPFQPRIRFGSTFAGTRFYSSGPVADGGLCDESEQGVRISTQIDAMRGP